MSASSPRAPGDPGGNNPPNKPQTTSDVRKKIHTAADAMWRALGQCEVDDFDYVNGPYVVDQLNRAIDALTAARGIVATAAADDDADNQADVVEHTPGAGPGVSLHVLDPYATGGEG